MPDEKKPSNAPAPIKPLSGTGGYIQRQRRTPATAPDWTLWPSSRRVQTWQAIALSLNIDPNSLTLSPHAWMAGPGAAAVIESKSFPDTGTKAKFDSRYEMMRGCLQSDDEMLLLDFATWAVSVNLELPPELETMAQKPDKPAGKRINARMANKRKSKTPKSGYFSQKGKAGALARLEPMRKLREWALERYDQGQWKSANAAAHALKDEIIKHGRTIGAILTEGNAQRTIAEWFRKSV